MTQRTSVEQPLLQSSDHTNAAAAGPLDATFRLADMVPTQRDKTGLALVLVSLLQFSSRNARQPRQAQLLRHAAAT